MTLPTIENNSPIPSMAAQPRLAPSQSSHNLRDWAANPPQRLPVSASSVSLQLPQSTSLHSVGQGSKARSSGTWTTSSGELGLLSSADEVENRDIFVHEYNRLAKKHGVRQLIVDDYDIHLCGDAARCPEKRGWLSRILGSSPPRCPHNSKSSPTPPQQMRHRRSISGIANIIHTRRDPPKILEIQDLVRLSGKSMLYLPHEHAPCSLILPTCLRATAQYLAQNTVTRGIFRVSGSSKVITALFDYYCYMENGGTDIANTVRCATLPVHIQYSVHDVASTFKRLLSVLPGGILGSLALFDALVAIHSQLDGEPEFPRTKQTKVRARLLALAVGTIKSQFRRELICAVFGLLSLIGRAAEVTPREDEHGSPLPTADLMGYNALGIVFGPLLIGDMIDQYTMQIATPSSGMLLFPLSPPKLRRDRRKSRQVDNPPTGSPTVNKMLVANNITEMLISNWRDIVRQMKSLGTHCRRDQSGIDLSHNEANSPAGTILSLGLPKEVKKINDTDGELHPGRSGFEPETPTRGFKNRGLKALRKATSQRLLPKMNMVALSPTKEESSAEGSSSDEDHRATGKRKTTTANKTSLVAMRGNSAETKDHAFKDTLTTSQLHDSETTAGNAEEMPKILDSKDAPETTQVYLESVPPRESSRRIPSHDRPGTSTGKDKERSMHTTSSSASQGMDERSHEEVDNRRTNDRRASYFSIKNGVSESQPLTPTKGESTSKSRGIRLVELSPTDIAHECEISPPNVPEPPENSPPNSSAIQKNTCDRGVQCGVHTEPARRNSINSTPERFYPDRSSKVMQLARVSSQEGISMGQPFVERGPTPSWCPTANGRKPERHRGKSKSESWTPNHYDAYSDTVRKSLIMSLDRSQQTEPHRLSMSSVEHMISSHGFGTTSRTQRALGSEARSMSFGKSPGPIHSTSLLKTNDRETQKSGHRSVPSLGRMGPYREQPPIAHYLNLSRPASSASPASEVEPCLIQDIITTPFTSRPRSATVLYSQVRKLQRQLNAKSEEASQLRRQVEAQRDTDVGTVSEQLRESKRELLILKDRAETAERRVKVFERFTEKLKEIRDTIFEQKPRMEELEGKPKTKKDSPGDGPGDQQGRKVDAIEMDGKGETLPVANQLSDANEELQLRSESENKDDEAAVVAARLRECLRGLPVAAHDGAGDNPAISTRYDDERTTNLFNRGKKSHEWRIRRVSRQIWAVAEEVLRLNDQDFA